MRNKILIIDGLEVVRHGVRRALAGTEFQVVGEASTIAHASALIEQHRDALAVMEIRLPDGDSLNLARDMQRAGGPAVLFFTRLDHPTCISLAMNVGSAGMVSKSASMETLLAAIRQVAEGGRLWNRQDIRRVTGAMATSRVDSDVEYPLTQREYDVLLRMCRGMTNKKIADELRVSGETIKEHVQHILRKMGVTDRTQAAVLAVRSGLV